MSQGKRNSATASDSAEGYGFSGAKIQIGTRAQDSVAVGVVSSARYPLPSKLNWRRTFMVLGAWLLDVDTEGRPVFWYTTASECVSAMVYETRRGVWEAKVHGGWDGMHFLRASTSMGARVKAEALCADLVERKERAVRSESMPCSCYDCPLSMPTASGTVRA